MSKIALDEGVPEQIALYLSGHEVQSVRELHLRGTKNGKLLDAIEALGFDAFVSNDKKLEFDQNLSRRPFAASFKHEPLANDRAERQKNR